MKMKAIRYYAPQDIRYEEVQVKEPNENEVLVKIEAALTCGTDIKTFRRGHPVLIKTTPSGFGHEFAGSVVKVGENVVDFKIGDRVVAANSAPCGKCFYCQKKQYNLCENLDLLNGAYAEYITIPERIVAKNLLKLPNGLSFEKAAFCEPLANVVHGVERTNIQPGDTVGVFGIGPIVDGGIVFLYIKRIVAGRKITLCNFIFQLAHVLLYPCIPRLYFGNAFKHRIRLRKTALIVIAHRFFHSIFYLLFAQQIFGLGNLIDQSGVVFADKQGIIPVI